jgi:hypothetical protein
MSSSLVKAHGGSRTLQSVEGGGSLVLGGLVMNTMKDEPKDVHMRGLSRLVANTTGILEEKPIMSGVLQSTIPVGRKMTPEYHKVPAADVGKTKAKRMGQVPYQGSKY